jgi:hypothetical protein
MFGLTFNFTLCTFHWIDYGTIRTFCDPFIPG